MRRSPHPDLTRDFRYGRCKRWDREGSLLCVGQSLIQEDAWRWLAFDATDGCLRGCGYERSFVRAAYSAEQAALRAAEEAWHYSSASLESVSAPASRRSRA